MCSRARGRLLPVLTLLAVFACVTVEIESPEGRDLLDRLPAEAVAVFGGDGDVPDYLQGAMHGGQDIEPLPGSLGALLQDAGVEQEDLDAFAGAVLSPGVEAGAPAIQVATLLRGRFDRDRLERALSEHPSSEHEGTVVYRLDVAEDVLPPEMQQLPFSGWFAVSLAVLDEKTLVMGTELGTRAVLAVEAGAASLRENDELMALVEEASEGAPTHWGAFSLQQLVDEMVEELPEVSAPGDRPVRSVLASARVDADGARGRITIEARDEAAARLQEEALEGALATLKLGLRGSRPELFGILERAVQTEQQGAEVRVEFELTAEDLVTLQQASVERARELLEEAGADEVGGRS